MYLTAVQIALTPSPSSSSLLGFGLVRLGSFYTQLESSLCNRDSWSLCYGIILLCRPTIFTEFRSAVCGSFSIDLVQLMGDCVVTLNPSRWSSM